jgi:putative transcriptional regulator
MAKDRTPLGLSIEEGLREAIAHRRGEIALETRVVNTMSAGRVREIRKAVAKSPKEFEKLFGVPARTIEGWEQGRKLDIASRILLTVIEKEPEAVRRALTALSA